MSISKIRTGLSNIKKHNMCFRSQDRVIGISSPTDFTIDLGTTILDIVMYELQSIELPFTYYNINNTNNQFRYTDTGPTARTLTIKEGHYDINNLMEQIIADMTTTSNEVYRFELSYQNPDFNLNNKVTIKNDLGATFALNFSGTTNSIAKIIGYDDIDYGSSSTFSALSDPNFNIIQNIYLESSALSLNPYDIYESSNISITNIIWKFNDLNNSFGDIIIERPEVEERTFRTNISALKTIDFKFKNDLGDIIDINGFDTNICMILYTKENNNNYII